MKGSLIIVGFFVLGIIFGLAGWLNVDSFSFDISFIALALLMFCVGIGVGSDFSALKSLKSQKAGLLLLPLVTIIGTLGGCALVSLFIPGRSMSDVLAVGSGFGYYSLSSIFITEYRGAELGTVALLANISSPCSELRYCTSFSDRWHRSHQVALPVWIPHCQ